MLFIISNHSILLFIQMRKYEVLVNFSKLIIKSRNYLLSYLFSFLFLDKATMDIFVNGFQISDAMVEFIIFNCYIK